jgi:hypothetical protein
MCLKWWVSSYEPQLVSVVFPNWLLQTQHSATDISNFDEEFTKLKPVLTLTNSVLHPADQEEFRGFTYVSEWAQENRAKVRFA